MRAITICLLLLLWCSVKAQNINESFFNQMNKLPIDIPDLIFHYVGMDTARGIEIKYYHKTKDRCNAHIFFISDDSLSDADKRLSLQDFLIKSGNKYHYIKYANYSSFFGCEYNDIDSFKLCRNENIYSKDINTNIKEEHFYQVNNEDYFAVARVEAIIYKFISHDIKYSPFFYHFKNSKSQSKEIEKLIYKHVLRRDFLCCPVLFKGLPTNRNVDCISKYY